MVTVGSGKYTYSVRDNWASYPTDFQPAMAAVAVDSQDRVYGFHRGDPAVIIFDREGRFLGSWGSGIAFAHAITIDQQDNVWLVDRNNCQVLKFTREGKPLMAIGTRGYRSDTGVDPTDFSSQAYRNVTRGGGPFNLPAGIAIAPSGDIFIADGYANCRVHRFSPDGKLLLSWGDPGDGPGQFRLPHGVWVDSSGRVLVADRENDRVQVFSQEGQLLAIWPTRLVGPAAFYVDAEGVAYVPEHNGGYFSVLTLDGQLLARWGEEAFRSCHGVAGDSHGDIYFVQPVKGGRGRRIVKYVRQR